MELLRVTDSEDLPYCPLIVSQEATSFVIEEHTSAHSIKHPTSIIKEHYLNAHRITSAAKAIGMRQSVISNSPFMSVFNCIASPNSEQSERTRAFIRNYNSYFGNDIAIKYGVLTSPIHLSISYKDFDHLFNIARRVFYLTPLMYMISENTGGYMENKNHRLAHIFGMTVNRAQGNRGGIPEYFFRSQSGEEYVRNHINFVRNQKMFMHFDKDGDIIIPHSAIDMKPFREIADTGLGTRANYDLAESMNWHDGKLCNIRTHDGTVIGKRFEIRMWDNGPSQFNSLVTFVCAFILDTVSGQNTDELLVDFGLPPDPADAKAPLLYAMEEACNHGLRFMDVPYGKYSLRQLGRELYKILQSFLLSRTDNLDEYSLPLAAALELGQTETQVVGDFVGDIQGLKRLMTSISDRIYLNDLAPSFLLLRENGKLSNQEMVSFR